MKTTSDRSCRQFRRHTHDAAYRSRVEGKICMETSFTLATLDEQENEIAVALSDATTWDQALAEARRYGYAGVEANTMFVWYDDNGAVIDLDTVGCVYRKVQETETH